MSYEYDRTYLEEVIMLSVLALFLVLAAVMPAWATQGDRKHPSASGLPNTPRDFSASRMSCRSAHLSTSNFIVLPFLGRPRAKRWHHFSL